ncbi:hypothetical protein IMZ08_21285 [Bacillus luteolus]|uniref:Uncharacterized protein n=1 Tax=Litchfieldia luteola TaxID=682179 RepID=A0ABR9QQA9_9BACI|nr:hypothetical protein [Cytobacillus luteolus]MBE4910576.1 hypothetical protein [Cytobacillus luteolus]MBP1943753.1 hypothetical protein [Cytobacillus luteolus]
MNKKKFVYIFIGLIFVLISTFIYLSYFSHPSSFLSEKQLIEEINSTFPDANVNKIQGIFDVNEKNKYVPFISNNNSYGKSFWVWDKYKWRVAYIDTTGEPHIWKVNKRDPSSYHFVWNIHPDDQLKHINFYMIRDRGYSYTQVTKEMYYPRVQMQQTVSFEEETYGVLKIPEEWATFVRSINDTQLAKQSNLDVFFNQFSWEQHVYYGWIPYDQENKEAFPEKSVNGSGYSNGDIEIDYVMILNEWEVEK